SDSRLFAHLARHEPWGASIVEALAMSTLVVATRTVGSARELAAVLPSAVTLIDWSNPQSAALHLIEWLRQEQPSDGAALIRQTFGPEHWLDAIEGVCKAP